MNWIARQLNRLSAPQGRKTSKKGWTMQHVRSTLTNPKYIGSWRWGLTRTIRNSRGKTKQVPVPESCHVIRDRPQLRIVGQSDWTIAQKRINELHQQFGYKDGQKRRGPKADVTAVYPRSLLGGLLFCHTCGNKLHYRGGIKRVFYQCSAAVRGQCPVSAHVPAKVAEAALVAFVTNILCSSPSWLETLFERTCAVIRSRRSEIPQQVLGRQRQLSQIENQINNLVEALANGNLKSSSVRCELERLEGEAELLRNEVDESRKLMDNKNALMPDRKWLRGELARLVQDFADSRKAALVLRQALGKVRAEALIAPGKKRCGSFRLHFHVQAWALLKGFLGNMTTLLESNHFAADTDVSPPFEIQLGSPTKLDIWAPKIVAWREQGVTWKEIVRRTGLDLNRAYIARKRYLDAHRRNGDAA